MEENFRRSAEICSFKHVQRTVFVTFFNLVLMSSFLSIDAPLDEGLTELLPEASSLPPLVLAWKLFRVSWTTSPLFSPRIGRSSSFCRLLITCCQRALRSLRLTTIAMMAINKTIPVTVQTTIFLMSVLSCGSATDVQRKESWRF